MIKQKFLIALVIFTSLVLIASGFLYFHLKRLHNSTAYIHTVKEYVDEGKLDQAIEVLRKTLSKNKNIAEAHAALGMIYNKKDMNDEALTELKTALTINPELISVYQELYKVYKKLGMEEEAQKALDYYEKQKATK